MVRCEHCSDPTRIQPGRSRRALRPGRIVAIGGELAVGSPGEDTRDDSDRSGDGKKREALVELRDRYVEARELGSSLESHTNLEWILGARRNPTQDPLGFETNTIEVVALWLQDLAIDLERRLPVEVAAEPGRETSVADDVRRAMAQNLRDATDRFLTAFSRQN